MKRHVLILFAAVIFTLTLASCTSKYDAEDFIGKTSAEIVDENGDFDCVIGEADNGIYSNCKCGYTIKEKKAGFLGSSDEAWEKIMEEQKLLTERRRSIDADINSNRELKRYHEDCMEDITDQVYSLHGISVDKLEGIKEYKNALFRGEAFIVFCISVIMAAIVAYAYGPTSQLCLYILMCVGAEGALLSQKRKNILFFIPLILIAAEMIGYKLYPQYLEYVTMEIGRASCRERV